MQRRAGRPKGEAATVVNVRIPLSLVERLDRYLDKVETETGLTTNRGAILRHALNSILKFFQVDSTGILRMTSSARYFKEGVGSSRPNWRWIICFLECPKANTSCKALVKCCRRLCGSSDAIKSSITSTRHSTCTLALRLPTVYAGRLFLSWASWAG